MEIAPANLKPILSIPKLSAEEPVSSSQNAAESFSGMLNEAITKVDSLQKSADSAIEQFVAGKIDVQDVMVQVEKASVAMQLTVQLRNKVVEAYQEVMRMQV